MIEITNSDAPSHEAGLIARPGRSTLVKVLDIVFILLGIGLLFLFTTVYLMPFRLDDVLHMQWAVEHEFLDAWHPVRGEIVRSVRPMFAATIWLLTHYAGLNDYWPWHLTLVGTFLIALAFAGLTARYISRRNSSLYFTTILYWLAFTPIVNVLFWYGDLTFTIELMFVCSAWYFGLKGLLESRTGMWLLAVILGACAVMSKEPAIPLVHGVWLGALVFRLREVKAVWAVKPKSKKILFGILYALVVGVSAWIMIESPTKANRFFDTSALTSEQLKFFVTDRINYYSSILLSPAARLLLITPLVFMVLEIITGRFGNGIGQFAARLVLAAAFAFLFFYPLWLALILLVACLLVIGWKHRHDSRAAWLAMPFLICVIVIVAALLITVMLVKTQLNELALTVLVISGWAWSRVLEEGVYVARPHITSIPVKVATTVALFLLAFTAIMIAAPKIAKYEQLLRDARDVRTNANDAIKYAAKALPNNSLFAVTAYSLHGIKSGDDLTSKDDATKLAQQYTFNQGYNYVYFNLLNRRDILVSYLEDSTIAMRALDSLRASRRGYLFIQTAADSALFYGLSIPNQFLKYRDTLIKKFDKGPYPSEIWYLRQ
ncbi:MAG TPA: hypothetical protein VFH43_12815 [Candidatus Kapabacteria bacterium]|nr:hypothetical protein [Candidatus Kapabacteria bacterium]